MSTEETLAFESRRRVGAAALAAAAAALMLGGNIALISALRGLKVDELTTKLLYYDHHRGALALGAVITALGLLALIGPLAYLYRATKARRPELPQLVLFMTWFGPPAAALGQVAFALAYNAKAHEFAQSGGFDYQQAKHVVGDAAVLVPQYFVFAGQLALGFAFVLICLNAMRVGLLTRFMGILGIIAGVLFVIPFGGLVVVQPFWLGALAALIYGRWPNGVPPAWSTGKAEPWPTQQEMREEREKLKAQRAEGGGRPAEAKAAAQTKPADEPEPAAEAAGGRSHPSSKKRKRKRRR